MQNLKEIYYSSNLDPIPNPDLLFLGAFVRFVKDSSGSVVDFVGFYVDLFEALKAQGGNSIELKSL